MKFYLCQTEVGPQYVHLQADAKKIDPNYETVELDTSKGPLMDLLNDLMRQAHGQSEEPAAVSRPAPVKTGATGTFAKGNEPVHDHKWQGSDHLVREGEACNVCMTRKAIAGWRASGESAIEIESLVVSLTDPTHLANISAMITERQSEIKPRRK